ncbi:uncharacterized protein LOC135462823 [Liolophura sinensis]|uniref:uncharacterized protein LOC135462823 n=1 Tax=Liolophura sinensis TaxID=3198878 RepID=UPI0031588DE2
MTRMIWIFALAVMARIAHAAYVPYDCRRSNQVCVSDVTGGQCTNTGSCVCTDPNFTGYDCSLPAVQERFPPQCSIDCGGRGRCYDDGFGAKCFCDPSYYGDRCQFDRVSVQCFTEYMTIRVFPINFNGEIFVATLPPDVEPACQFEAAPDGNGFLKNLSFSDNPTVNPCLPNLSVATSTVDGTNIFTYEISVKYNPRYTTFVDEIHTVTCEHTLNGPLVGAVIDVDGGPTNGVIISGNATVLDLDITRESDGVSVSRNNLVTFIGEDLNIKVSLKDESRYKNHKVENCGAYNYPLLDSAVNNLRLEKRMVADGCPAPDSQDVISGPLIKTPTTVFVPFKAFKFNTGELHIYCSVRVCLQATDALCQPDDCTAQKGGPGGGFGRKKRQSGDDQDVEELSTSFYVVTKLEPGYFQESNSSTKVEEKSCFQTPAFLAVTVVFSFLLIITLVVTVIMCLRYMRREKELTKGDNSARA